MGSGSNGERPREVAVAHPSVLSPELSAAAEANDDVRGSHTKPAPRIAGFSNAPPKRLMPNYSLRGEVERNR